MSCTETYNRRKALSGTGVAPTPSKGPQRPSKAILEWFCKHCWGTGELGIAWGYTDPCPYCKGTGYAK